RSREIDDEALPARTAGEIAPVAQHRRVFGDVVLGLALELDVPAEGDEGHAAVGVAPLEPDEPPPEAEREDEDAHPEGLGGDEVAELVEEDDDPEDGDEGQECGERSHSDGLQGPALEGFARALTRPRVRGEDVVQLAYEARPRLLQ